MESLVGAQGALCYPRRLDQSVLGGLGVPGWQGIPDAGLAQLHERHTCYAPEPGVSQRVTRLTKGQGRRGLWAWRPPPPGCRGLDTEAAPVPSPHPFPEIPKALTLNPS